MQYHHFLKFQSLIYIFHIYFQNKLSKIDSSGWLFCFVLFGPAWLVMSWRYRERCSFWFKVYNVSTLEALNIFSVHVPSSCHVALTSRASFKFNHNKMYHLALKILISKTTGSNYCKYDEIRQVM